MHRAFWAVPRTLTGPDGRPVNVVFGVGSMLVSILKQEQPDGLVWCADAGSQTFRHQEHVTYKEGRAETPQEFYDQQALVLQLLQTLGVPVVSDPAYEADDLLCSYARQAEAVGTERITVVTGDRDAYQLASEHIRIAIPHKGYQAAEYLGPAEVLAQLGVTPAQVPAFKGLAGDSSDNLPGVKGIGPKTAAELLQQFGSLEGVYEHLADIRSGVREKLEVDREQAFFCQRMAVLIGDIPLPCSLEEVRLTPRPLAPLADLCSALRFQMLLRRIEGLTQTDYGRHLFPDAALLQSSATPVAVASSQLSLF